MNRSESGWSRRLQSMTALYSLCWLLAANMVGVWLAALLIWPDLGKLVGEFGYGRWMPMHMDWQLYGWCSLPLVGLLMYYYLDDKFEVDAHLGFLAWSIALGLGGILSLNGIVSGKLFLNWSGVGRVAFPVAQVVLWAILVNGWYTRWRRIGRMDTKSWLQLGMLALLLASPLLLFWTAGNKVFPPIDPESGGATGHSLLASSLGVIGIFGVFPLLLKLKHRSVARSRQIAYAVAFVISLIIWLLLDHGNASNTQIGQILGLGILVLWAPLVALYYRAYRWPTGLQKWLYAFFFWWAFLTLNGFINFLPGILDVMKFTNGLVAHAHLAMAGMVSAFNMLILGTLGHTEDDDPWCDALAFWLWQGGVFLYVVAMTLQGVREGLDPTVLFGENAGTTFFYSLRLVAGCIMIAANLRWMGLLDHLRRSAMARTHWGRGVVYE